MSQSVNFRALQWAYEQEGLSATMKDVLVSFALHADRRGYTWPGVLHIAFIWNLDRRTVRRQIRALIGKRMLCRTEERRGATGQVKVYRLPKITWESGGKLHPFENDQRGPKGGHKGDIRGTFRHHEQLIINKEQRRISDQGAAKKLGNSTPNTSAGLSEDQEKIFSSNYQNQNQPAQSHVKWPEFASYCRSKDGTPSEAGFWSWLCKQKPQWRNKIRRKFDGEEGYELNGKFFTPEEAIERGKKKPELITKFRKAINRDGKIQMIS